MRSSLDAAQTVGHMNPDFTVVLHNYPSVLRVFGLFRKGDFLNLTFSDSPLWVVTYHHFLYSVKRESRKNTEKLSLLAQYMVCFINRGHKIWFPARNHPAQCGHVWQGTSRFVQMADGVPLPNVTACAWPPAGSE